MAKKKVELSAETQRSVEEANKRREQLVSGSGEKKVAAKSASKKSSTSDKAKEASGKTQKELEDLKR